MTVSTCVKNVELLILLSILCPMTLYFKEEVVLATHPPSFHPRRVFDNRENGRKEKKMREKESYGKTPTQSLYMKCRKNEKLRSCYKICFELI